MLTFQNPGPWQTNSIFLARAGSAAYGTKTPESDVDYRGVFLANESQILGLNNIESYTEESPIDLQCYELRHFLKLCLKGSPLQVELLFYPNDVIESSTEIWNKILAIRNCFLGKHLKFTFGGFAQSDVKRIQGNSLAKCGAKGKLLVEKYGYNTKQASSSWRLLKMAELLWTTGELVVRLPENDRNEIISIKQGKYTREEFLKFIQDEDTRIFKLVEKSDLPPKPDFKLVEKTMISIYREWLKI